MLKTEITGRIQPMNVKGENGRIYKPFHVKKLSANNVTVRCPTSRSSQTHEEEVTRLAFYSA